jgi:hypothetical protein
MTYVLNVSHGFITSGITESSLSIIGRLLEFGKMLQDINPRVWVVALCAGQCACILEVPHTNIICCHSEISAVRLGYGWV